MLMVMRSAPPVGAMRRAKVGDSVKAYVAGPLFDEGERWWIERVDETVAQPGSPPSCRIATTPQRRKQCGGDLRQRPPWHR